MDKLWAKDVKEGEKVKSVFLVARKAIPTAKSGKTYLSVTFHDKTGELEARAFDEVEKLAAAFEEKDFVEVEGQVGTFQGKPQLRIDSLAKVDAAGLDAAEFAWAPPPEPKKPERSGFSEADEQLWKELHAIVDAIVDPHVKALVRAFLEDEDVAGRLRRAPAAKTVHHAYPGGLLEHTVSSLKLAHRLADHYPQVDRDLLVAGAFFHDLGKIRELTLEKNTDYTDEGRLIGHHVMTAQWIHDKARRHGVPRELETHVVHLVLAHHGKVEYGSPRPPATLEALLTHYIDELDSRVNSWLNLMGRDGGSRRWTDAQNVYNQHIWRGTLPTVQVEKKGPPAEVMTPVIYVPREGQAPPPRMERKKQRPPRPERKEPPADRGAAGGAEARGEAKPGEPGPRPERTAGERGHGERPQGERPVRGERSPAGAESNREQRSHGPGFGPRGPGDRKPRYMGPRLPGDKGPQARPAGAKNLTHNPFAALAAKLEGAPPEEKPAEGAAGAPADVAPPETGAEQARSAAAPEQPPPGSAAEGATAPPEDAGRGAEGAAPEPGTSPAEGEGR